MPPPVAEAPDRRAVAMISVHASPLGVLGGGENGGMNLAIRRLCEELSALGIPTDVFTRRAHPDAPTEQPIAPLSRLIRVRAGPSEHLAKDAVEPTLAAFAEAVAERARGERRPYRLLHSHYWLSGVAAMSLRETLGLPWVHSAHTLARSKEAAGLTAQPVRAATEATLVARADRLVASSEAERRDLVHLYGADLDRVCLLPLGVDPRKTEPSAVAALRGRDALRGRRSILYAGRLERLKGLDLLIDAMAVLLRDPAHQDVLLLVAGADSGDGAEESGHPGGETGRLLDRAAALGIAEHVRFVGSVPHEELALHYAAADVVAVPSRTESFGLAALEALASGTPVVATAAGGLSELIEDGVEGLLVDRRDPELFASRLAEVLRDSHLARRLSAAGRLHAERYSWKRAALRLATIFEGVERASTAGPVPCPDPVPFRAVRSSHRAAR